MDLETLIATNFKRICDVLETQADIVPLNWLLQSDSSQLSFFRVKCARPMTFQYITLQMVEVARINGGFIGQTEFKTGPIYTFDTLIISEEAIKVLDCYICHVRSLLNPMCDC